MHDAISAATSGGCAAWRRGRRALRCFVALALTALCVVARCGGAASAIEPPTSASSAAAQIAFITCKPALFASAADALFDHAEDRVMPVVFGPDANRVTPPEERRRRRAAADRLDAALFGDA